MKKFTVYQDPGQWLLKRWWYWKPAGSPDAENHGPFPFRFLAVLAARLST